MFAMLNENNGATLRIIGINGRQEIRFTGTADANRLFIVGASGTGPGTNPIRLILGENITIVGREGHGGHLITVRNGGRLEMEAGSIIRAC